MKLIIVILLQLITFSKLCSAQEASRTIAGRVQDTENNPIPFTILTLADENRNVFAGTIADSIGLFEFQGVAPGVYFLMETNMPGFVDVSPNEIVVDVTLQDSLDNLFVDQLGPPPTPLPTMFPTPRPTPKPTPAPTSTPTRAPTPAPTTPEEAKTQAVRARRLQQVNTRFLDQEHNHCMDVEYDMFLVIEGFHLAGLASPTAGDDDKVVLHDASCPSVVLHASPSSDGSVVKESLLAAPEEVASFHVDSKHYLGKSTLRSVMKAYDMASVGKDGAKFYDPITNNCVALLRNMADPLQVEINDPAMIDFVTDKLLLELSSSSSGDGDRDRLWEGIYKSPSLNLVVDGAHRMLTGMNMDKRDILRRIIKLYL